MDKQKIFDLIADYYAEHHKKEYRDGDKINYAGRVYDAQEMIHLVDSALDFWLTSGKYCDEFEKELCAYLGINHCHLVNSGSSANLLAFMALTSPLLKERAIQRGDEVISVAAAFPTTVSPIVQYGAVPVFVDIKIPEYNIDESKLEQALSKKTKAVFLAHSLGNPFHISAVKDFCIKNNLWLIEDNCDALGSEYAGQRTGTFGDIGTSSFYPAHNLTMGEGGAVYTNDPLLSKIMLSIRDWGRDCACPSGVDNLCGNRFNKQYGQLPQGYDHKYVYSHFGYNLKATEMQAAIGCAQIKKLDGFTAKRRKNWQYLYDNLKDVSNKLLLPEKEANSEPSPFGFIMTCKEGVNRDKLVLKLEEEKIQTRMLFGGNILRQPCFESLTSGVDYKVSGDLSVTDEVMNNSFWIGVYPGMTKPMLDRMIQSIQSVVNS